MESIEEYAFYGCGVMTGIIIPDGVTSIGDYSFAACGNLRRVVIADSVESIGNGAFQACRNLRLVVIERPASEGITELGNSVFVGSDPSLVIFVRDVISRAAYKTAANWSNYKALFREARDVGVKNRVIICTVKGDIHDIGKNLVATMLRAEGYEVIDLGVDVSAEKIVEAVELYAPRVVALSAAMTTTMPEMKVTIDLLTERLWREFVRVIVGGGPVTQAYANSIGADGYSASAADMPPIIEQLEGRPPIIV